MSSLDREVDHCPPHLHCFVVSREERCALLNENKGPELALVVFEHELAVVELDLRVAAGNRDVVNSEVALMATAKLEDISLRGGLDNMDDPRSVLLLVKRFEHHVVACLFFVLHELVLVLTSLDHQRVSFLADFTFESLPEVGAIVLRYFFLTLHFKPRL